MSTRISGAFLFFAALLIMSLGFVSTANADITTTEIVDIFSNPEGDTYSNMLLHQIFGAIYPDSITGGSDDSTKIAQVLIGYFNMAMLVVAGLLFFSNVATGTLQSAHEGKVLGQRYSSLWAPLRVVFAAAMMIPLPNVQNYNTAQLLVSEVSKASMTFASRVWEETASLIVTGLVPVSAPSAQIPQSAAANMFNIQMCRVILDNQFQSAVSDKSQADRIVSNVIKDGKEIKGNVGTYDITDITKEKYIVTYDRVAADGVTVRQREICGRYASPVIPDYIDNRIYNSTEVGDGGVSVSDIAEATTLKNLFADTHKSVLADLDSSMYSLAQSVYATYKTGGAMPDISTEIQEIVVRENKTLNAGYKSIMTEISNNGSRNDEIRNIMLNRIRTDCGDSENACLGEGWIGAGSWYMMIAQLNGEISGLYSAEPTVMSSDDVRYSKSIFTGKTAANSTSDEFDAAYNYGKTAFNNAAQQLAALGWSIATTDIVNLTSVINGSAGAQENPGWIESVVNNAIEGLKNGAVNIIMQMNDFTFGSEPIIGIVNVGQGLTTLGGIMIAADAIVPGNTLSSIGTIILSAGATMSIILPMMPFVFWTLGVIGYLLLIVEAFVAVNLWALSHMRMDGDGISGQAGQKGWMMMLNILVTPTLMVIGYMIGMIMFRIGMAIMSLMMKTALSGVMNTANPVFLCVAIMTISIFFVIMYMLIIEQSFSLVSTFPDKVLRWVGETSGLDISGADKVRAGAAGAAGGVYKISGSITRNMNLSAKFNKNGSGTGSS